MTEFICAGFGGQGVLKAGLILADAGMKHGKQVTWFPSYGAEVRGGTANCHIKISDEEIASPYVSDLDVLVAMNEASIDKLEKKIKPGGWLVFNQSIVKHKKKFRSDINVAKVDATDIAAESGNMKGINIVMLGALAKADHTFEPEYLKAAVDSFFNRKGKINPKNAVCFDQGLERVVISQRI